MGHLKNSVCAQLGIAQDLLLMQTFCSEKVLNHAQLSLMCNVDIFGADY